jgi:hypothetical protein
MYIYVNTSILYICTYITYRTFSVPLIKFYENLKRVQEGSRQFVGSCKFHYLKFLKMRCFSNYYQHNLSEDFHGKYCPFGEDANQPVYIRWLYLSKHLRSCWHSIYTFRFSVDDLKTQRGCATFYSPFLIYRWK